MKTAPRSDPGAVFLGGARGHKLISSYQLPNMPKMFFWNLNRRDLRSNIVRLCAVHDPDILILAESVYEDKKLVTDLSKNSNAKFYADMNFSKRIKIYSRFNQDRLEPLFDDGYVTIRECIPYLGLPFMLVAVHLPSKLHATETDQLMVACDLARIVKELEIEHSIDKTVIIGDFNMAPFEPGMVSASGLHAMLDKDIVKKLTRTVRGKIYPYFYNPMWSRLGDLSKGPPGTFRYNKAVELNHVWHTYDQVIMRPPLMNCFSDDDLIVIDERGSDHFPLFFNLRTENLV